MLVIGHGIAGTGLDLMPSAPGHTPSGFVDAVLNGAAEVMFGANIITGGSSWLGIALSSWRHAVLALVGSVIGTLVSLYHHDPRVIDLDRHLRLQCGTCRDRRLPLEEVAITPALAAMVSVPLTEFFPTACGVPPLTAPFVAASWIVLGGWWFGSAVVLPTD